MLDRRAKHLRQAVELSRLTQLPALYQILLSDVLSQTPMRWRCSPVAVRTLEVVQWRLNSLGIGAMKFLGSGLLRRRAEDTVNVCGPEGTYDRVAHLVSEYRMLEPGRLTEYDLNLAAQFSKPDPYVVTAIANSAFNDLPQQSGIFESEDIRPLARSVLAGFRERSAEYAELA